MSPSASIIAASAQTRIAEDSLGRRLSIRNLTALDRLRIFKAAGPELSLNQPWLAMAALASSVTAINDVPIPPPGNEAQIEAVITQLGDAGLEAVAAAVEAAAQESDAEQVKTAGN
jgi:hypothetical protein